MSAQNIVLLVLTVFFVSYCHSLLSDHQYVANLDDKCLTCLCHAATGCNESVTCVQGYCGPFKVSKVYWVDSGRVVQDLADDPDRPNAFEDCAFQYNCAAKMVKNYMSRFGRDCNEDGVTDCYDFMMINYNGGSKCQQPLEREENSQNWLQRYNDCYEI